MEPSKKEDFKYAQRKKKTFLFLAMGLGLALFFGLNVLAAKYYGRKDITQNHKFSLSPESVAYLKQLTEPVEIIITISPHTAKENFSGIYKDIVSLAEEYQHVTRNNTNGKINISYIDPYTQSQATYEIAKKYNVQHENAIIIATQKHHKEISGTGLYTFKNGDITAFRGEQAFTSAILDVTGLEQNKVYFLMGHGEMRIDNSDPLRGISQAAQLLQRLNYNVEALDLTTNGGIPSDADLIVIPSPQTAILPLELEMLKRYLSENNGKIIAFLDPEREHGLTDLLHEWGIHSDNMVIMDPSRESQANGGDQIIRHLAEHSITNFLIENQITLITGPSRPVRPDPAINPDSRNHVQPLMASSEGSWAMRWTDIANRTAPDPKKDLIGPITIATLSERKINTQLGISITGGKILAFGNSGFITNNKISALGNNVLFQNAINWAMDKNELLNIPARSIETFQLTLSQDELYRIAFGLMSVPAAIGFLGILTYTLRKR